ncbi:trypsin-like peptidase domain-containing protein [Streptomyces sp. TRM S81-3]|uniref:Trypsin-like peptidase domain-containing protein n=1 Tax=Streptomyces griseicoloratus TaxID=2752516 RepID=A0A926QTT2_9ACTN|nr:trypsin-like peptidase domain-containing protein [Streptomyces griseicoloratus]MBD0422392.1 trypsin-like peptidase domain-containing protein [Streptomyces griseicoloratus]
MSALEDVVRPSLARIVAPGDGYAPDRGEYWGSGFFIAPGWLLTCAHVVGKGGAEVWRSRSPVGVTWQGGTTTGEVVLAKPRPEPSRTGRGRWDFPDIALVRVHGADDARCVWLSDRAPTIPAPVGLHGWSRQTGALGMRHGIGEASTLDGKALLLTGSLPVEGVSGGPVVDRRYGSVIAMNKGVGRTEGAAVPITALRELYDVRGGDILHTVMREHDLHHLARFTRPGPDPDWTRTQARLRGPGAPGLAPALRVHLYGHFAHLPPPDGPADVTDLVQEVKSRVVQEDYRSPFAHGPRTWREGAGLLHGLRDLSDKGSRPELDVDAVLLYAAKVARHTALERAADTEPERLGRFTRWIEEQATLYAHAAIREDIDGLLSGLCERAAGRPAGPVLVREEPPRAGADVLLDIGEPVYGERYPLSVRLLYDGRDVTPVYSNDLGVRRHELQQYLREPLAEALRLGDRGEHLAVVEAFLPRALFDEPLDEWRLVADDTDDAGDDEDADLFDEQSMPLGLRRTVLVRDRRRNARPPTPEWRRRWTGAVRGPLTGVPLRGEATDGGHPPDGRRESRLAAYGRLSSSGDACVPVFCGPVGSGAGREAMAVALAAGHPLVLWRRDGHDHDECRAFHRSAARLLGLAGRAEGLHRHVRDLRIGVSDPENALSEGLAGRIAVLYDPPDRPPYGTEMMRPPPMAGPAPA